MRVNKADEGEIKKNEAIESTTIFVRCSRQPLERIQTPDAVKSRWRSCFPFMDGPMTHLGLNSESVCHRYFILFWAHTVLLLVATAPLYYDLTRLCIETATPCYSVLGGRQRSLVAPSYQRLNNNDMAT